MTQSFLVVVLKLDAIIFDVKRVTWASDKRELRRRSCSTFRNYSTPIWALDKRKLRLRSCRTFRNDNAPDVQVRLCSPRREEKRHSAIGVASCDWPSIECSHHHCDVGWSLWVRPRSYSLFDVRSVTLGSVRVILWLILISSTSELCEYFRSRCPALISCVSITTTSAVGTFECTLVRSFSVCLFAGIVHKSCHSSSS